MKKMLNKILSSISSKRHNREICSTEGLWNEYFNAAEKDMDKQWELLIWPEIKDFNFDVVLELAPGAGRNTEKLAQVAKIVHAVDMNEYALEQLRDRFAGYTGPCELHIHRNSGSDLGMLESGTITAIYCWDAAVHFDKAIVRDYVKEFARVMKPGSQGFVHHSNLGSSADSDISKNPSWRSNMSKELFRDYCKENDLELVRQIDLPWEKIVDCVSIFRKS